MSAPDHPRFARLAAWLSAHFAAPATVTALSRLSGGAIQENWLLDVDIAGDPQALVLRTDAASVIATSLSRAQEYAILSAAHGAGVCAPAPVALCEDISVIGTPFYLMQRGAGSAHARRITRDPELGGYGPALAVQLGEELAKLHRITPPQPGLDFLTLPSTHPALARIARYRADLDQLPGGHPVLEYALNWLEDHLPTAAAPVLCHCDFRTGNYMIDQGRLTVILDWEFAGWSDPDEDIGWLTARCWRFGNDALTVGGIAWLEPFLTGYERASGRSVNRAILPFWQIMAEIRWAIIALQQGERCNSGTEISQELALSGVMPPEMELNILTLIDRQETRP